MAVKLRLARGGSKKRPFYSIVAADERSPRDGRFIERVGTYNPMLTNDADRVVLDAEKAAAWLAKGAQPTDRVARILDAAGVLKRDAKNNPSKGAPGKKAQERVKAKIMKEEEAKAAAEKAKADAEAAANAPAVEAPAVEAAADAPAEDAAS